MTMKRPRYHHLTASEVATMLSLHFDGIPKPRIAQQLNRPLNTVKKWLNPRKRGARMRAKIHAASNLSSPSDKPLTETSPTTPE